MTHTVELTTDLEHSYFGYAMETIVDRALPRLRDGLKPGQRRILYAMHDMGLSFAKPHRKAARVVGEVLGKYHPHGDASVYMTLVRMAQDFSLREPLIDGQGNFGSVDGDAPAAMRYTEVRLSAIAAEMMRDLERGTVEWAENFDGSLEEPVILPAALPNLLVNGSSGLAVGMATNIPPHNLGEVCDALTYVVGRWAERAQVTVDDLLKFIPGPDFPTGGVAYRYRVEGAEGQVSDTIRAAYETGRGRIVTQARVAIEETKGGKADIIVTELPYAVQKSTVLERIAKEVREGRITGVTDLRDESDYTGMRVVIEVSRAGNPREVLEALLTYTQLRQTFGVINLALVEEEDEVVPKLLPLREMLTRFVEHRLEIIERRSRHELAEKEARLHIIQGLLKALEVIDEVIATIKKSKTPETARANLMKNFDFSEIQAQAILDMQLRRLAALERAKLKDEGKEVWARIKYLKELLASEEKRLAVVVEETAALKEAFAGPRRTVILDRERQAAGLAATTEADLARPEETQIVVMTTQGVRRFDKRQFSDRVKAGVSARAVEMHLRRLEVEPEEAILLISSRGRAWRAAVGRVPDGAGFAELGLAKGEYLIGADKLTPERYLVLGTHAGAIKRTRVEDLGLSEASWASVIGLGEKDELLCAGLVGPNAEVIFFTAGGKAIRFATGQVNPQATASARGVVGVKLGEGDRLVAGAIFEPGEGAQVILASQEGYLKRMPLAEFPAQGRGGQGIQSLALDKATGKVVAGTVSRAGATVCDLISARGLRQRLELAQVPLTDRRKRGEKLILFGADDAIVGVVSW
jgi:DNA gyrase subunit A